MPFGEIFIQHFPHFPPKFPVDLAQSLRHVLVHGGLAASEMLRTIAHCRTRIQNVLRTQPRPSFDVFQHFKTPPLFAMVYPMSDFDAICSFPSLCNLLLSRNLSANVDFFLSIGYNEADLSTNGEQKMRHTEFSLFHRGRTVRGTFFPADNATKFVVFSHGFNGAGDDFFFAAETLASRGIGAATFDFCGGSARTASFYDSTRMTLSSEREDLDAVIEEVRRRFSPERLFLFGASMGGLVTALYAEQSRPEPDGIVLLFPALCIPDDWRKQFPAGTELPDERELWGVKLGKPFFEEVCAMSVFDEIGKFSHPVLLIHGECDKIVPVCYSQQAAACYPRAKLFLFPNEGHGFSPNGNAEMTELLLRFLSEN